MGWKPLVVFVDGDDGITDDWLPIVTCEIREIDRGAVLQFCWCNLWEVRRSFFGVESPILTAQFQTDDGGVSTSKQTQAMRCSRFSFERLLLVAESITEMG